MRDLTSQQAPKGVWLDVHLRVSGGFSCTLYFALGKSQTSTAEQRDGSGAALAPLPCSGVHSSLQLTMATERAPLGEELSSVFHTRRDAQGGCWVQVNISGQETTPKLRQQLKLWKDSSNRLKQSVIQWHICPSTPPSHWHAGSVCRVSKGGFC